MNVFHGCIKTFFIICFDPRGGAKSTDGATSTDIDISLKIERVQVI